MLAESPGPVANAAFSLENDGFTVLKAVFAERQLAPVREFLQRVIRHADQGLEDPFERYYLRHRPDQGVLYDLFQRHAEVRFMASEPRILAALEAVCGPDLFMYENSVVYKPRGRPNGVPFHQDFISRPHEPIKHVAWMAIDRVSRDSGALKVIPGSHRRGFLPWLRVHGETHHDRIRESDLPQGVIMHVELEPGDVLVFNQLLVHGSDEMHTDSLRLVYRVSYQGIDEVFVPRGAPIMLHGGTPESLAARFPAPYRPQRKPLWRRGLSFVGRKLSAL